MDQLDSAAVLAVAKLAREAAGKTVKIDDVEYSTTPLHDPRKPEPEPNTRIFKTLLGFADLAASDLDREYLDERGTFAHILTPERVYLATGIFGEHCQRADYARAEAIVTDFQFGRFIPADEFVIALQAQFVDTDDRSKVLALVGNLESEAVTQFSDDGQTQRVQARAGIVKRAEVNVPNPVTLRPYRTFTEVKQPSSPFVLRMKGGGDGRPPACALFEADGGRWRLDAIASVRQWLQSRLGESFRVYG